MQDSGLYEHLKTGDKKTREFKWRSVPYAVSEAEVRFTQKGAPKVSFLVLGGNKDLMSFVRIRFTYPKSMQKRMNSKRNAFTRTVMSSLHDFAETLIPPAPENAAAEISSTSLKSNRRSDIMETAEQYGGSGHDGTGDTAV